MKAGDFAEFEFLSITPLVFKDLLLTCKPEAFLEFPLPLCVRISYPLATTFFLITAAVALEVSLLFLPLACPRTFSSRLHVRVSSFLYAFAKSLMMCPRRSTPSPSRLASFFSSVLTELRSKPSPNAEVVKPLCRREPALPVVG